MTWLLSATPHRSQRPPSSPTPLRSIFSPRCLLRIGILLLAALLCLLPGPLWAHWADLATADVQIGTGELVVTLVVPTGLLGAVDDDHDGRLSEEELARHAKALSALLEDKVRVTVPSQVLGPCTLSIPNSLPAGGAAAPSNTHSVLALRWAITGEVQDCQISYQLFDPGAPKARCTLTFTAGDALTTGAFTPSNRTLTWNRHSGLETRSLWKASTLHELLNGGASNKRLMGLALGIAFVLGALHGLSPGHGKALVGSYLVGSRGTVGQALLLGLVVTITHTSSVLALGVLCLTVFHRGLPPALLPWLEATSGLGVSAMGVWLLWKTRGMDGLLPPGDHALLHEQGHGHGHDPDQAHHDHGHGHDHGHDHHHPHDHDHDHHHHGDDNHHSHDHDHPHEHSHTHDGVTTITHTHGPGEHAHSHAIPSRVTLASLIALGVSGGMVPCPEALAVLLSALAMNQLTLGLLILVAFSAGLAAVLMALGVLAVRAGQMLERAYPGKAALRHLTRFSYVVVTLLGLGIAAQALSASVVSMPVP